MKYFYQPSIYRPHGYDQYTGIITAYKLNSDTVLVQLPLGQFFAFLTVSTTSSLNFKGCASASVAILKPLFCVIPFKK